MDVTLGYYLGEAVKYDANQRRDDGDKAAHDDEMETVTPDLSGSDVIDLSPLLDCYDSQRISQLDLELGRTMGIMGDCMEVCYASSDADPQPRSARISPDKEQRENTNGQKYYAATVYTDRTVRDYQSSDLETALFHPVSPATPHYFGAVPVIAYENNAQRQGDFEQVMSLIDAYDQLLSDRVTDKRKFVDALLVFFGMTLAPGEEEKLVKEKFIDGAPLDAKAEYIQKTFDESSVQILADAIVREIHKQDGGHVGRKILRQRLRAGAEAEAADHESAGQGQDQTDGEGLAGAVQPV